MLAGREYYVYVQQDSEQERKDQEEAHKVLARIFVPCNIYAHPRLRVFTKALAISTTFLVMSAHSFDRMVLAYLCVFSATQAICACKGRGH